MNSLVGRRVAVVIAVVLGSAAVLASGGSSGGSSGSSSNGDETSGKALQHSEDVKIVKCGKSPGAFGGDYWAKVTVTNHSSKASDYVITVAFESKDGKQQFGTGDSFIDSLQPGQSKSEALDSLETAKKPFKCVLSDAERTESSL